MALGSIAHCCSGPLRTYRSKAMQPILSAIHAAYPRKVYLTVVLGRCFPLEVLRDPPPRILRAERSEKQEKQQHYRNHMRHTVEYRLLTSDKNLFMRISG